IYLFRGPALGKYGFTGADLKVVGDADYGSLGHAVSGAGDVDGDGQQDFVVGADGYPVSPDVAGAVCLFHGPGLTGEHTVTEADARFDCPPDALYAGWAVAAAGDLDADGYDDFMITAPWALGMPYSPTVYVVYGRPR
ncbi:integrin alpha, partial [Myxococcota bacterium]|nr:integrin alpha [Myxococcota bacterium]